MIVSCFDAKRGLYDYYETGTDYPFNADLPIPRLPNEVGGIGVPAIDAARPKPPEARHVGSGWTAKGIIVDCNATGPMAGMTDAIRSPNGKVVGNLVLAGLAGAGVYALSHSRIANDQHRKLVSGLLGLVSLVYLQARN